jgi:hypothetical protein
MTAIGVCESKRYRQLHPLSILLALALAVVVPTSLTRPGESPHFMSRAVPGSYRFLAKLAGPFIRAWVANCACSTRSVGKKWTT